MCIRVLIADDQPRARRSLKALLTALRLSTPGDADEQTPAGRLPVEIVGEAENGREAIERAAALHPDVVLMDLHLQHAAEAASALDYGLGCADDPDPASGPDGASTPDGAATIRIIKSRWPDTRIVVLTMYATDRVAMLSVGADAFLLKGCSTEDLLAAVMNG